MWTQHGRTLAGETVSHDQVRLVDRDSRGVSSVRSKAGDQACPEAPRTKNSDCSEIHEETCWRRHFNSPFFSRQAVKPPRLAIDPLVWHTTRIVPTHLGGRRNFNPGG